MYHPQSIQFIILGVIKPFVQYVQINEHDRIKINHIQARGV